MTGNEYVGDSDFDIEAARLEMFVDRLERSGWLSGGGSGPGEVHVAFYRQEGKYSLSPGEAALRLRLSDEEGNLAPGFEVREDDETGELVIGYSGPDDSRFRTFYEDLVRLGKELDTRQAAEQSQLVFSRALPIEATNKMIRQIESAPIVDQIVEGSGHPRATVIALVIETAAGTFFDKKMTGEDEITFLQEWHRHVDARAAAVHASLHEQFPELTSSSIDSNPTFEILVGMKVGLEEAIQKHSARL